MAATLMKFFVYAPYKTEPGTYEKRLSVRTKHNEAAESLIATGYIRTCLIPVNGAYFISVSKNTLQGVGGALLSADSIGKPDNEKRMVGSAFICEAASIEEVRTKVESDVYFIEGVVSISSSKKSRF